MTIPIVTGTTCPSEDVLALDWSLVIVTRTASPHGAITIGYVGRIVQSDAGAIDLADPFDYQCLPHEVKSNVGVRLAHLRSIKPVDGLPIERLLVHHPSAVLPFSGLPRRMLTDIRETLVQAWEGRAYLRRVGSQVSVPGTTAPPR